MRLLATALLSIGLTANSVGLIPCDVFRCGVML